MKNILKYYYNLEPDEIHQNNNAIKFTYLNKKYILYETKKNNQQLNEIYKLHIFLLSIGFYCHKIVLNINNEITTRFNNKKYTLLQINIVNRIIDLNDILYLCNIPINNNEIISIKRQNWYDLWKNKIDYIEYQISQFEKKYPKIRESSDYYIGIAENCISILNNLKINKTKFAICHDRINTKTTTEDYYNPLEFIIDIKVRDVGEYLKAFTTSEKVIEYIKILDNSSLFTKDEIELLFIRILYPSDYFDIYERIINNLESDIHIEKYQKNIESHELNIKKIYNYIRSISDIPKIEWLTLY